MSRCEIVPHLFYDPNLNNIREKPSRDQVKQLFKLIDQRGEGNTCSLGGPWALDIIASYFVKLLYPVPKEEIMQLIDSKI